MIDVITPEDAVRVCELLNNPAVSVKLVLDDMLMVVRKNGKFEQYDAIELTKEWIDAGDDEYFKNNYGFDWIPTKELTIMAQKGETK